MEAGDPDLAAQVETASTLMGGRQELINALHAKYVGALEQALDKNAIKSRAIMRSAAYMFALNNEIFTIASATGLELAIGGTETTGEVGSTEYSIQQQTGPADETGFAPRDKRRIQAKQFGTETTSAAVKRRTDDEGNVESEVGGYAYGGAVPAPVQSLDAATVALTASGKSWNRLKAASNGNPYMHTIYDAFKVDAMGYDVVLDEVNKNWLNASMNWSYLEETQKALEGLRETFQEKFAGRPDNSPLTEGEARQVLWFTKLHSVKGGKKEPTNLINKMSKLIEIPPGVDGDGQRELGRDAARNIVKAMRKDGHDIYSPPNPPTVGYLKSFIKAFNGEVNIGPRLARMINETNNNKKKLGDKIRRDGKKVYQYYAH